jgi:hypothetical protein
MAKQNKKTARKAKKESADTMLVRALGNGARKAYLDENPHGFKGVKKVHKNKNGYTRKRKHKIQY